MTDLEKVLKGLECCAAMSGDECRKCPYRHECLDNDLPYGMSHLAADALTLLKEQEAKKPIYNPKKIWGLSSALLFMRKSSTKQFSVRNSKILS